MRRILILAVLACGCGGSQSVGGGGPQAGGDHFLRGLYGGTWEAGPYKGTTLFGIAKDGLWTGSFRDADKDLTFVTDPDPADGVDAVFVSDGGAVDLVSKFDETGQKVRLVGKITKGQITGTLTVGATPYSFGCALYAR